MNTMFDASFGLNGIVISDFNNTNDQAVALGIQSNQKIILAGTTIINDNTNFLMIRYNTDGTIDTSFGINSNGRVVTDINNKQNILYNILILNDDKIILCGKTLTDITLVKYNENGIIDTTFGTNGMVITNILSSEIQAYSINIQNDNKIIVGGTIFTNNYSRTYFFIIRYNTNGTIDTSFANGNGYNTFLFSGTVNKAYDLSIQNDNKILMCGITLFNSQYDLALLRINSNGIIDTTFGINGKITTNISIFESLFSLTLQSDGKIIVAGETLNDNYDTDICVIRYLSNGIIDTTFGNNGIVITNLNNTNNDTSKTVVIQQLDKIIVAGYTYNEIYYSIALVRYNTNGTLDKNFGLNGIFITNIDTNDTYSYALKIQSDDKILIGGYNFSPISNNNFLLIRLLKDKPTTTQRKNQGATIQDLIDEGYDRSDILNANYTPYEYSINNFTPNELQPYFSDHTIMLQTSGFSPSILKQYAIITNGIVYFTFTIILNDITYSIIEVCYNLENKAKHIISTINNGNVVSYTEISYDI